MVIKVKVSDVAKDFGKSNKDIIGILSKYSDGKKTAGSVLEEKELNIIFEKLTQENSVKSFDSYFNKKKKADNKKDPKKDNAKKSGNKKHQSQAAILQMAEQAAKRITWPIGSARLYLSHSLC